MQLLRCLLSLSLFTLAARAIRESEVGIVDWHTKLVGVPRHESQLTAPVLRDDIVLTATGNNVLAALNTTDGNIVWRTIYDAEDPIIGFKIHDNSVYTLSGPGGSTLRTFDVSTGDLVLEKRLHNPVEGKMHDRLGLGVAMPLIDGQDGIRAFTLANGDTIRCINPITGDILWEWRSPDQGSLVMYTQIYPDTRTSTLYVAGLAKSVVSYTLHATTLDFSTGEVIASVNIPGNLADGLSDFFLVGPMRPSPSLEATTNGGSDANADEPGPFLVWLTPSSTSARTPLSLYSAPLSPLLQGKVLTIPDSTYKRLVDVGLASDGLFMAFRDNGAAEVIGHARNGLGVRKVWDFGNVTASNIISPSHFVGALNEKGEPRIGRVYWSNSYNQVILQTLEMNVDEGTGKVTGFLIPFETHEHGTLRHVTFLPAPSSGAANDTVHKILLVTSTGSVQLWAHNSLQWIREESLTTVKTATFVELPRERGDVTGVSGKERFWSQAARQIEDAKNLPGYIVRFVTRFVTGLYASSSSPVSPSPLFDVVASGVPHSHPSRLPASTTSELVCDLFSFRQLIIVSTSYGKLFALDSSTGAIVWSRLLGLGWAAKVGGQIIPSKVFAVRGNETESNGNGSRDGLALVTQRKADNSLVDTVIFHFDPLTGEDIKFTTPKTGQPNSHRINVKGANGRWVSALEGVDVIAGPAIEVFSVPDGEDTIGMLDEFLQVQLYPDTPTTRASLTSLASKFYLNLRAGDQVYGHQFGLNDDLSDLHVAYPTWSVSFGEDEKIISIIRSSDKGREAASIGRVKGDRSTLYKYLNPHMSIVLTALSPSSTHASKACGLYVIDTVKGTVLYHVSLPAVDGKCDIQAVLDENWLVYSYYDDGMDIGNAKSHRVVSVEMYEGYAPDEKISSSDLSSYSNKTAQFSVYERAFIIPYAVTSIATTTTKLGITSKGIIVSSRKNGVHSIPRHLLNPRRPRSKPTSQEVEEMLIQYEPVIPDDERLVLSHYYEVADVRKIVTAPSRLESTSLVLAIGTDLFLTRIAPSGTFDVLSENFNKVQLVLTVVGLVVAIVVTKPMVRRKKLRERWYL